MTPKYVLTSTQKSLRWRTIYQAIFIEGSTITGTCNWKMTWIPESPWNAGKDNWCCFSNFKFFKSPSEASVYTTNVIELTKLHIPEALEPRRYFQARPAPVGPLYLLLWGYKNGLPPSGDWALGLLERTGHYRMEGRCTWVSGKREAAEDRRKPPALDMPVQLLYIKTRTTSLILAKLYQSS